VQHKNLIHARDKKGACFLTGVISLSVKYKVYNKIN